MRERAAIPAEQQGLQLQQVRICLNTAALDTETKEQKLFTFRRPKVGIDLQRETLTSSANP